MSFLAYQPCGLPSMTWNTTMDTCGNDQQQQIAATFEMYTSQHKNTAAGATTYPTTGEMRSLAYPLYGFPSHSTFNAASTLVILKETQFTTISPRLHQDRFYLGNFPWSWTMQYKSTEEVSKRIKIFLKYLLCSYNSLNLQCIFSMEQLFHE